MATFEAQVEGLTSISIDGSSAPTQTELTQFLTDGAKEIINVLPPNLVDLCSSSQSFTSGTADTLNTGKVLRVFRSDGDIKQPCRRVNAMQKGRFSDSEDMNYATVTDPVYYIENNSLDVLPVGGSVTYSEVQYPSVAYGDSAISVFPDEAEYLVPLYASIKSLQNVLGDKSSNADITTALTAMNTELDETQAVCDKIDADLVLAKAEVVLAKTEAAELATQTDNSSTFNTALAAIATELNKVDNVIDLANDEFDEVAVEVSATATSPISAARTAVPSIINVSDLSIAAVPPDVPTITASTVSFSTTAPSYASPTTTISGTAWATAYPDEYTALNTALGAMTTELNKVDNILSTAEGKVDAFYTSIGDIDDTTQLWDDTNKRFAVVKNALDYAGNLIDGNAPDAAYDVAQNLLDVNAALDGMQAHLADGEAILTSDPTSGDIATALTAMKNAIEAAENRIDKMEGADESVFGDEDTFLTANSQLTRVKDALDKVSSLIEANKPASGYDAHDLLQAEDIELLQGNLSIVGVELQRAQMHLSEWTAIGDMRVKEVNASLSEAQAYGSEIQARLSYASAYQQASAARGQEGQNRIAQANTTLSVAQQELARANVAIAEINTIIASYRLDIEGVSPYLQTAQGYIGQASGYAQEVQALLSQTPAKVSEYQAKVQDALNEFNDDNAEYQAQLQVSIQNAQLEDSEEGKKIQKYSSELQQYQAEVNAEVQEYQQNLDQKLKEFDSSVKLQQSYYQEADARVKAGNAYLQEAQSRIAQAQGYAAEVGARVGFSGAKSQAIQGHISTAQSYVATAQGFGNEIQAKIGIIQGYGSEVQSRLGVDAAHYGWYEKQQAKLQADYDKGLQMLIGGGMMPQQQ